MLYDAPSSPPPGFLSVLNHRGMGASRRTWYPEVRDGWVRYRSLVPFCFLEPLVVAEVVLECDFGVLSGRLDVPYRYVAGRAFFVMAVHPLEHCKEAAWSSDVSIETPPSYRHRRFFGLGPSVPSVPRKITWKWLGK
jgi:hypothetical protein